MGSIFYKIPGVFTISVEFISLIVKMSKNYNLLNSRKESFSEYEMIPIEALKFHSSNLQQSNSKYDSQWKWFIGEFTQCERKKIQRWLNNIVQWVLWNWLEIPNNAIVVSRN